MEFVLIKERCVPVMRAVWRLTPPHSTHYRHTEAQWSFKQCGEWM